MSRTRRAVADRLDRLQETLGIKTRKEMAALAGLGESTWSEIRSFKRDLSRAAALKLKDSTGVTMDWLYDGDPAGLPLAIANKLRASAA